jgi:hypothetical protein
MYALKLRDQVLLIADEVADMIHAAIGARRQFVERVPLDLSGSGEHHEVTLNLAEVRSMTLVRKGASAGNVVALRRPS